MFTAVARPGVFIVHRALLNSSTTVCAMFAAGNSRGNQQVVVTHALRQRATLTLATGDLRPPVHVIPVIYDVLVDFIFDLRHLPLY